MKPETILFIYVLFFGAKLGWETLLDLLNRGYVKAHKDKVPQFMQDYMDRSTYEKSVAYTLTRGNYSIFAGLFSSLLTLAIVLSGSLGIIDNWIAGIPVGSYTQGILYLLSISLIFQLIGLPFSLYSQFVIEAKFGFNKMTLKLFFLDTLKSLLLSAIITIPLLYLLFWFMDKSGSFWWLYAFGIFTLVQLLLTVIYPTLIAPIFNKFTPMEEGPLKEKIDALAKKLDFKTNGIYKMDGSKRSRHSNAYFTGLGKVKRIVLFDTLIESQPHEEILAILAHEIGHQKKKHIPKQMFFALASSLIGFYVLSLLLNFPPLFKAFGFAAPAYHAVLVLLMFCSGPFTFFLKPLFSILSRKYEYEADAFAVKALGQGEDLQKTLLNLSKNNLMNLTPHPLYSFYYYSHPTIYERVQAIQNVNI